MDTILYKKKCIILSTFAKKRLEEPSMQENQATNPAVVETGIDHEKTPTSKTFATQNSSDSKVCFVTAVLLQVKC